MLNVNYINICVIFKFCSSRGSADVSFKSIFNIIYVKVNVKGCILILNLNLYCEKEKINNGNYK